MTRTKATNGPWVMLLAALATAGGAANARAVAAVPSRLALPVVAAPVANDWLAQRVIDREWGPSEDSVYREIDVPGWKSEPLAAGLSAVLPGTGQLYAGDAGGWWFLVAEAAGWTSHTIYRHSADRAWSDLVHTLGNPEDPASVFSFARYESATGTDPEHLRALWEKDRTAFYHVLHDDPDYLSGFSGANPTDAFTNFDDQMRRHDNSMHAARIASVALWLNHILAAADALRATRLHNLPLAQDLQLQLAHQWRGHEPELRAALVRSF